MASAKSKTSSCKPVTRKDTDIWLVGQMSSTLNTTKLPSKQEVMALFFHHKETEKTVKNASHCTAEDVVKVWAKASIPTRLKKHVVKKIEDMFKEWTKLRKNKENKAKRSEGLELKETKWQEELEDLFDIAHADALNMIKNKEDKNFLLAQRKQGRPGLIGAVDVALYKQQARRQKRQESLEQRKFRAEEETLSLEKLVGFESSSSEAEEIPTSANSDISRLENVGISDISKACSHPHSSTSQTSSSAFKSSSRKRGHINVFDNKFAASLDVAKLSDRGAAVVITPFLQNLGRNPAEYKISYATIRRKRMKHRQAIAEELKANFRPQVPLTVHWDGKLLPDVTGKESVDRLPILVSGEGVDQLLAVPMLPSGSGKATAAAVYEAALAWGVCDQIKAMSFDTTAVNTGRINGACVLVEQKMGKELLWLACRHHILEIVLAAVTNHLLGPSKGPDIAIFQRFQAQWAFIDQSKYQTGLANEQTVSEIVDNSQHIIAFAQDQLDNYQPRDDYQELLELTIIFLGGAPSSGISFKRPAGLHRARWMAKLIYSLKIWLFRTQFKLTSREIKGLQEICLFAVQVYIKAWYTAPSPCSAPRQDLWFLKAIYQYPNRNISKIATNKFLGHLWYLSEELVALAFFDDNVPIETKREMVTALNNPGIENPSKRANVEVMAINMKDLPDFVTANTMHFFEITGLSVDFLSQDPALWENSDTYVSVKTTLSRLRVVNDIAERGVALINEYNELCTKDEEQKQFLLLAVKNYRQQHSDRNKFTLMQ